jgi:hypothetical protein
MSANAEHISAKKKPGCPGFFRYRKRSIFAGGRSGGINLATMSQRKIEVMADEAADRDRL